MSTAVAEEKKTKLNQLEQIKKFTKVVADTADFESMKEFRPQDATTNPSLVYAATQKEQYSHLLDEVLKDRKKSGLSGHDQIEDICDHLLVQFGTDILEIVPNFGLTCRASTTLLSSSVSAVPRSRGVCDLPMRHEAMVFRKINWRR